MWFVSHHWPGVTPFNVYDLPAHWWAYYVRLAEQHLKEAKRG
jgi:hypothetical protein